MAPLPKINLAYLHLTYVNQRRDNEDFLHVQCRHNMRILSDFIFTRYDWAKAVLNDELIKLSKAPDIDFSEWRFETSKEELFRVGNVRFEKVFIFLGENKVHWSFYNDRRNALCLEGQAELPLTYCSCCLQEHFVRIVNGVKEWIQINNIKPETMTRVDIIPPPRNWSD